MNSSKALGKFEYRPIESPDQLRMLWLLPGSFNDAIQIRLCHRPLSTLRKCEALSYEWGSPTRDYEIYCEGQTLKVTGNLLAAMRRMRSTTSKPARKKLKGRMPGRAQLLWIDAICINQDDMAERSEQVKLMTEIYRNAKRVLIWLGEEPIGI
jgi:hypothetical protein